MGDFTEFGIEVERHLSKLGKDIQQFVEKVVPLANEDKDFAPDCDIVESEEEFKILLDLPGLSKKEIGIALKNSVLTVKGEREVKAGDGEEFKRQERKRGAFARSFAVPQDVNAAEIKANFRNGVLTIAMPKSEALKDSQSIPVK
ncbi:MAG: Hsp20/alpha crystallin family protein [Balneolaceae bacterium]|nr:Hsp20/alpha crystallin family protein [Balneolaceae bacterium]